MHDTFTLLVTVVILALIFDFINGFLDSENAIATSVSTKVLSPKDRRGHGRNTQCCRGICRDSRNKMLDSGLVEATSVTQVTFISSHLSAITEDLIT
jgi:PiT family inorganic phosphate transporter